MHRNKQEKMEMQEGRRKESNDKRRRGIGQSVGWGAREKKRKRQKDRKTERKDRKVPDQMRLDLGSTIRQQQSRRRRRSMRARCRSHGTIKPTGDSMTEGLAKSRPFLFLVESRLRLCT